MKSRFIALSLLVAGLFSTSCFKEDYSECHNVHRLILSYKGDGTTEIFPEKINRVEMYVFDSENNCVVNSLLPQKDVDARETVLPTLDPGDYRVICIGNTHETSVENLSSCDFRKIIFAADDYLNGKTVRGNDSLYYASVNCTVKDFDPKVYEEVWTADFASSHYDIYVEVVNAPYYVGKNPKIELVGVSPQTDFENEAKGTAVNYIMETVHDGVKTTTARNNIMRHKNHEDVYLKVTGEDGSEFAVINFAEHIEKYKSYINPDLHECLIPFRIEYTGLDVGVTVSLPTWVIENITPEF